MFLILFFIVMVRMLFWLAVIMVGFAFAIVAMAVALIGAGIGLFSSEAGAAWKQAAGEIWQVVTRTAQTADNHKRWVLPNKRQGT